MDEIAEFWGERGAGCLIKARDTGRILIELRSDGVEQPNTWGTWGGEVDPGELVQDCVIREMREETGYRGEVTLEKIYTFVSEDGFVYDTFMATVPAEFEPEFGWETEEARWVEPGDWPQPLHYGLEAVIAARPELAPRRNGSAIAGKVEGILSLFVRG